MKFSALFIINNTGGAWGCFGNGMMYCHIQDMVLDPVWMARKTCTCVKVVKIKLLLLWKREATTLRVQILLVPDSVQPLAVAGTLSQQLWWSPKIEKVIESAGKSYLSGQVCTQN